VYISLLFHLQFSLTLFCIYLHVFLYVPIFFNFYFLTLVKMFQIGLVDHMISMIFSPILCDAVTMFVYTDQFFCCCAFTYSNFHGKYVTFCMVAVIALYLLSSESYETINFTLSSTITKCIQMLKTTNTGTKCTYIICKQLVIHNCYSLCILLWLCVADLDCKFIKICSK